MVDFEEQYVDSYDTFAVRAGAKLLTSSKSAFSAGFVYEPAAVGSGERGADSTTGFGTIDFIPIFAGIDELKPYTRVVMGYGQSFGHTKAGYDKYSIAGGVAYQQSSLGIDEKGELPAAYAQRKIIFPLQLLYRY